MRLDENWIRAHLPEDVADQPIDCFSETFLDGLTVMHEGERGGDDVIVYRAKDEEDLRWWQLEQVCRFIKEKNPPPRKTWRYIRDHAEDGRWFYRERRTYDYNAIEDPRLYGFECFLRTLHFGFPKDRWEESVREHVCLMNYWFAVPHWDYDREKLCFVEISLSRENDGDGVEEPRPGSVLGYLDEEDAGRPDHPEEREKKGMEAYSKQDLEQAAEFRAGVHAQALEIVQRTRPEITQVVDRHPVEDYFQEHWDYPGRWYTIVAIPYGYGSRKALIQTIVNDTLAGRSFPAEQNKPAEPAAASRRTDRAPKRQEPQLTGKKIDAARCDYEKLFTVRADQKSRSCIVVGVDAEGRYILEQYEEYSRGGAAGSTGDFYLLTEAEYRYYAKQALLNGQIDQEAYDRLCGEEPVKKHREIRAHAGWDWDVWFWTDKEEFPCEWKPGRCRWHVEKAVGRDTDGRLFLMVRTNHDPNDWRKSSQVFYEIDRKDYIRLLDRAIEQREVKPEDREALIKKPDAPFTPRWDIHKALVVYRDDRYTLGQQADRPYLIVNGEKYILSCHPYEPCLYITDRNNVKTSVHNAFDPFSVLETFSAGGTVRSITGLAYSAKDFCRMVEYAAGQGDIGIETAEQILRDRQKTPPEADAADSFDALIASYPACVVEYCIVPGRGRYWGYESHRDALKQACGTLFAPDEDGYGCQGDPVFATGKRISASELFSSNYQNEKLNYRKAFLYPPHGNKYTGKDFARVNAALFPNGTEDLEVYEWSTDWSDYFDDGHEWWGALCLTVYDGSLDRFAVIMASATD